MNVAVAGNLAAHYSGTCSKRWYFIFNGHECSSPAAIDGLVYKSGNTFWPHRHKDVEGYCENAPAGNVTVMLYNRYIPPPQK